MPALPLVPNVVRVEIFYQESEDANVMNRHYFSYGGGTWSTVLLGTLLTEVKNAWGADLANHFTNNTNQNLIKCTDLASASTPSVEGAGYGAGTGTGSLIGAGSAMLLNYPVPRRYRGGHPRTYLTGRSQGELQDSQTWTSAAKTAMAAAYAAFLNDILSVTYGTITLNALVNVSYYSGYHNVTYPSGRVRSVPTVRTTPLVDQLGTASINPKVASQRRRNLIRA